MNLGITARARELAQQGFSAGEIEAVLCVTHKAVSARVAIRRLREQGYLPAVRRSLSALLLKPSPSMQDSLRRLSEDRDLPAHRVAHMAMVAGLALMEARR